MLVNHHLDEIYKRDRLDADTPRRGDRAEIVRDHHSTETGMEVKVVNDPHKCELYCAECGQMIVEYAVEVESPHFKPIPGAPFFYPLKWLRRINGR